MDTSTFYNIATILPIDHSPNRAELVIIELLFIHNNYFDFGRIEKEGEGGETRPMKFLLHLSKRMS
jgi:hypothetical protein